MPLMAIPPATRGIVHGGGREVATRRVASDEHASRIAAQLGRAIDQPRDGGADLADDLIEARGGRQRVLDHRQVESRGQERFAKERVRLLIVHLPVAAVDVGECGRARPPAGEEVEAVPRPVAVAEIERAASPAHRIAPEPSIRPRTDRASAGRRPPCCCRRHPERLDYHSA